MSGNANIIIVKKKKSGHGGHHSGSWKVAFADFMTAMMAFFMVMWLIAMKQDVKAQIAAYFRDPGAFETTKGSLVGGGPGTLSGTPTPSTTALMEKSSRDALEATARKIRDELARDPAFKKLSKQIEVQLTKEGLRIELIDSAESMFFDSGSAYVKEGTSHILGLIARELSTLDRAIILEGHTDARPYAGTNGYSNWELSADRANAARRLMEAAGLKPEQVRAVRGFADRHLRVATDRMDARNRRVSIVVPLDAAIHPAN
jgi:chemotaxis protein MotB